MGNSLADWLSGHQSKLGILGPQLIDYQYKAVILRFYVKPAAHDACFLAGLLPGLEWRKILLEIYSTRNVYYNT